MWTTRLSAGVLAGVWVCGPAAAQVRTETVAPASTDAAINAWLGNHAAAYSMAAEHPTPAKLFLFMHGQGGSGAGAMELLRTAAEEGFHAIGVTYPNDWSPFNVCAGDPLCPENLRREIIDGTDRSPLITVTRANSLENRVIKLLARLDVLHPGEGWGEFVVNGEVQWSRVTVWGHSQGGGNAGVLARLHTVERACLSAPAADGGPSNPAAWWASHVTPAASYFGFCHTQDQLATKVAFWDALGMGAFGGVVDVAGSAAPFGGTHELSSSVAPAVAGQYHNSVVMDAVTPRGAGNVPVYKPVWRHMMTAATDGGGGGSGQVWNDVVYATVPTFAGTTNLLLDVRGATAGGTGPRPVLLWIHGGGWQSGTENNVPVVALDLRSRGITVASVDYRLSGEAVFPAQVHDCKGAIRYLRAHAAEFNIDPARIAVWGSSAGAHLAALVATSSGDVSLEGETGGNLGQSSAVVAGVSYFGPTDILNMGLDCAAQTPACASDHDAFDSPESALLGVNQPGQGVGWLRANRANPAAPFPALVALADSSNPITFVDRSDPPLYIAHGTVDTTVPINQSARLSQAALAGGGASSYTPSPGAGHGGLGTAIDSAAKDFVSGILLGQLVCPAFTLTPVGVEGCTGGTVMLTADASGTGPVSLRWRRGGIDLVDVVGRVSGAGTATLTVSGLVTGDGGVYDCVAGNACGRVSSAAAVVTVRTPCGGADLGGQGGVAAACGDGALDNNDFVVFINLFFVGESAADMGSQGGLGGSDGHFDNNDFVVFIDQFFAGC